MTTRRSGAPTLAALYLAATLLAACASLPPTQPAACPPPRTAANPDSLPDLSGTYRLVMVESTRHRSTQGMLSLVKRSSPQPGKGLFGSDIDLATSQPFYGTSTIVLDSVGAMTEGTLSSTDPLAPGAAITRGDENHRPTVELGLGSVNNDLRTFMNDGSTTDMRIERIGPRGFSGRWHAAFSYTTYRAAGTFCAVRATPR